MFHLSNGAKRGNTTISIQLDFGFEYCCVCWNKNGVFLFIYSFYYPFDFDVNFTFWRVYEWMNFPGKIYMFLGTSEFVNQWYCCSLFMQTKKLLLSEFENKSKQNKLLVTHRFGYRMYCLSNFRGSPNFFFISFFTTQSEFEQNLEISRIFLFFVVYFFNWKHFSFWAECRSKCISICID